MLRERTIQRLYRLLDSTRLKVLTLTAAELLGLRRFLVRLDTNNFCNLNCRFCPEVARRRESDYSPRVLRYIDFRRIAAQLFPRARILYLSCSGEPLLTPGFPRYLSLAADYGVPFISFATNGTRIDEELIRVCIERGVNQITVSLDGAKAETVEHLRPGLDFTSLLDRLRLLAEQKRRRGSDRPELRLNYVVMRDNLDQAPAFIDLAAELGADSVQFRPLTPYPGNPFTTAQHLGAAEQRRAGGIMESAAQRAGRKGIELLGHSEFVGRDRGSTGALIERCAYPWYYRYVNPSGGLGICPRRGVIGNLLTDDYSTLMAAPRMRRIQRDVLRGGGECAAHCAR